MPESGSVSCAADAVAPLLTWWSVFSLTAGSSPWGYLLAAAVLAPAGLDVLVVRENRERV